MNKLTAFLDGLAGLIAALASVERERNHSSRLVFVTACLVSGFMLWTLGGVFRPEIASMAVPVRVLSYDPDTAAQYGVAQDDYVTGLVPRWTSSTNLRVHASVELDITDNSVDAPGTDWFGPTNEGVDIIVTSDDPSVTVGGQVADTVAADNQGQANFTIAFNSSGASAWLTLSAAGFTDRQFPVSAAESGSTPTLSVVGSPTYNVSQRTEITIQAEENSTPVAGRAIYVTPSNGWLAVTRPMDMTGVYRQSLTSAYPIDRYIMTDANGQATFEVVPQMDGVTTDLTFSSNGYSDLTISDISPSDSVEGVWAAAGLPNNRPDSMGTFVPIWRDDGSKADWEDHGWGSKNGAKARFYTHCEVDPDEGGDPVFPSAYFRECLSPALSNDGGGTGKATRHDWRNLDTYSDSLPGLFYYRFVFRATMDESVNSPRNWRQGKLAYIFRGDNQSSNAELYPTWTATDGAALNSNPGVGATGWNSVGWDNNANNSPPIYDGLQTQIITVEVVVKASSNNVDANDGYFDYWVNGVQYEGDASTDVAVPGIAWRTSNGTALANVIEGMEFYHNVSGETQAQFEWRIHEMALYGIPAVSHDGTSYHLGLN